MAVSLTHGFTSAIPDDSVAAANGEVLPSHWNAQHTLTQATGKLLGRTTAGTGAVEEITPDSTLSLSSGAIGLPATGVGASSYGSATASPAFTVDSQGRLTAASTFSKREVLTAARTYYVRTDGSDSNSGLANSAGSAFLTIQRAIDIINTLDIGANSVLIRVADGTYTGVVNIIGPWLGSGTVTLQGNTTTPANCVLSTTGDAITINTGARLVLAGFKLTSSAGSGLVVVSGGYAGITGNMEYGSCLYYHMYSGQGTINVLSNYSISGGAVAHILAYRGGVIGYNLLTVTLTGTPAFGYAFAYTSRIGIIEASGNTYTGSATGTRYIIDSGGLIYTGGAGANYFPGNSAGSGGTTTGGGYYL